jgi:hypothetical protein
VNVSGAGLGRKWMRVVTICHIGIPLVNLTGCEIRFVLFGPDGRVTEWSLTTRVRVNERVYYRRCYDRPPQATSFLGRLLASLEPPGNFRAV